MNMARKLSAVASKKQAPEAQKRVKAMAATFKRLAQKAAKVQKVPAVKPPGNLPKPKAPNPFQSLPAPSSAPPAGNQPLATKPATPLNTSLPPKVPTNPEK
jgi:hypothetical protein